MEGLGAKVAEISIDAIITNPNQPRQIFRPETLKKLAVSMTKKGLAQFPLVKAKKDSPGKYDLVAGERRFRAARDYLGWKTISCHVVPEDTDAATLSLAENCNREELNPLDEAEAFSRYKEEKGATNADLAELTGLSPATIQNRLSLLSLPKEIREMIRNETLPTGSALRLIRHKDKGKLAMLKMARELLDGKSEFEAGVLGFTASHSAKHTALGRMPRKPESLMTRILSYFGWRANSVFPVVESFFNLPEEDRLAMWSRIPAPSREKFLERLSGVRETATRLQDFLSSKAESQKAPPREKKVSKPAKKEPKKPPPRLARPEEPVVYLTPRPAPATPSFSGVAMERVTKPETQEPLPPKATLILRTILYNSKEKIEVNLGIRRASDLLYGGRVGEDDTESQIRRTLTAVRQRWSLPPNAEDREEKLFRRAVANVRFDFGCRNFDSFLKQIVQVDKSNDPVNVASL